MHPFTKTPCPICGTPFRVMTSHAIINYIDRKILGRNTLFRCSNQHFIEVGKFNNTQQDKYSFTDVTAPNFPRDAYIFTGTIVEWLERSRPR